jgi:hypothetical protein
MPVTIIFGKNVTAAAPGSAQSLYLIGAPRARRRELDHAEVFSGVVGKSRCRKLAH